MATTAVTSTTEDASQWHGYAFYAEVAAASAATTSAASATEDGSTVEPAAAAVAFPAPRCVAASDDACRPGYTDVTAAEYMDDPATLRAKIEVLLRMWRRSAKPVVYTGAGISTAAGIKDYASRARGSVVKASDNVNRKMLPPTLAHRVLAAMEKKGMVHNWVQQNHDGLAQKAGFPTAKLNEIHGSWFDQHNPVLGMSDQLRPDLLEWLHRVRDEADFVVAIGTSLSGMTADSVCEAVAQRHLRDTLRGATAPAAAASGGGGGGLVIISLQKSRLDDVAALRIFARIDDVMKAVATKLKLTLDSTTYDVPRRPPPKFRSSSVRK